MKTDTAYSWCREFRSIDNVAVFHVDLTPNPSRELESFGLLSSDEQARWHRFHQERPRREFALVRSALRAILCDRLNCNTTQLQLNVTDYGKPFALLDQSCAPVSFNVSHSGNHGLIALSDGRKLGVDVEARLPRNDIDEITGLVFTPNEQAEVAHAEGMQKIDLFYRIWTLKEALIKAVGTGFHMDTKKFEIPARMRHGARDSLFRFPQFADIDWKIRNLGNDHLAAAIAYECSPV